MAKLGINVSKARQIHKEQMRLVRKPLLETLDVEFMKAVETGDTVKQAEIVAKKQELRDCTCCCDTHEITSTDVIGVTNEMKQCWDECLGENVVLNPPDVNLPV